MYFKYSKFSSRILSTSSSLLTVPNTNNMLQYAMYIMPSHYTFLIFSKYFQYPRGCCFTPTTCFNTLQYALLEEHGQRALSVNKYFCINNNTHFEDICNLSTGWQNLAAFRGGQKWPYKFSSNM